MFVKMKWQVILYDTKHGTNRFGLKLGCFVGIDNNGVTRIIAVFLLLNETEDSFAYIFNWFSSNFCFPNVIYTDGDKQMASAIKSCFPCSTHLLCTFHLYKNLFEKVWPAFFGKVNNWKNMSNMWWKLCKLSDSEGRKVFNNEWDKFMDYFNTF